MSSPDHWISLLVIAQLLGLSEDSIKRIAKKRGLPLPRVSPYATPGMLESEMIEWLKSQPLVGQTVRSNRRPRRQRRKFKAKVE
jgi:predicted DNA-binding transcriptional regulator AlpA